MRFSADFSLSEYRDDSSNDTRPRSTTSCVLDSRRCRSLHARSITSRPRRHTASSLSRSRALSTHVNTASASAIVHASRSCSRTVNTAPWSHAPRSETRSARSKSRGRSGRADSDADQVMKGTRAVPAASTWRCRTRHRACSRRVLASELGGRGGGACFVEVEVGHHLVERGERGGVMASPPQTMVSRHSWRVEGKYRGGRGGGERAKCGARTRRGSTTMEFRRSRRGGRQGARTSTAARCCSNVDIGRVVRRR